MNDTITLTRDQVRRLDRLAIEEYGIPGLVLMENAGRAVADAVLRATPVDTDVIILCGGGNNGGDGYVAARHLANAGRAVQLNAVKNPDQLSGDAAAAAGTVVRMGLPIDVCTTPDSVRAAANRWPRRAALVDALLGTGFTGTPRPAVASLIEACNQYSAVYVVSVDVPSGLDCETGDPGKPTVRADETVTFVARKPGFDDPRAAEWLGRVVVADIGAPAVLVGRVTSDADAAGPG